MNKLFLSSSIFAAFMLGASSQAAVRSADKPLVEVLAGIQAKTGIQFTLAKELEQNKVSYSGQNDANEIFKHVLAGYNYSVVWQGNKIGSIQVSGLNGSGANNKVADRLLPVELAALPAHSVQKFEFSKAQLLSMKPGDRIEFNLPEGRVSMVHDRVWSHANGDQTWSGHTGKQNFEGASFLTMGQNGVTVGSIETAQRLYLIEYAGGQSWMIDAKAAGIKETPQHTGFELMSRAIQSSTATAVSKIPQAAAAQTGGTTVIDLFAFYSSGLNATTVAAKINNVIAVANTSMVNSLLNVRIDLVGSRMVVYDDTISNDQALNDLSNNVGVFERVPGKRARLGVDLFTFVRPMGSAITSCGVAWVGGENGTPMTLDTGYTVIAEEDLTSLASDRRQCNDTTLAHEVGHNLGNMHDRANSDSVGHFSYSYGYCQPIADSNGDILGDVMSYCKNQPIYSTPNVSSYNHQAMGVAKAFSNSAFAAKTIRLTSPDVAAYATKP